MASHLIFGAGLIGGFMAGSFAAVGAQVALLGRERFRTRFENGLSLTDYQNHRSQAPRLMFYSNTAEAGAQSPYDFIWLTVKCTDLPAALDDLEPLVGAKTVLVSVQNGVGSEDLLRSRYPKNRVLRAIMQSNVAEISNSQLHRGSEGTLVIEDYAVNGVNLATSLNSEVLPTQSIQQVTAFSWAKLQINLANAVNALANIPVREMLGSHIHRKIIAGAMRELLAVADKKGITLPKIAAVPMHRIPIMLSLPTFLFELVGRKMLAVDPTVRTSMWWDLHNKRATEIDFLNGVVVNAASEFDLACPVNAGICEQIKSIETANAKGQARPEFDAHAFLQSVSH